MSALQQTNLFDEQCMTSAHAGRYQQSGSATAVHGTNSVDTMLDVR